MLRDGLIRLRALEPDDIDLLYGWENDSAFWQVSNTLTPFSRYILEQYVLNAGTDIYSSKQLRLMIELEKGNKPIGCIDLFDFDPQHKRAGIGILIADKSEQRKGHASAALTLMIRYSFTTLCLNQLYCNITSDNEASLGLFRRQGFKEVGLKKSWLYDKGVWKDEFLFQLIKN